MEKSEAFSIITQKRNEGLGREEIIEHLISRGWSRQAVESLFQEMDFGRVASASDGPVPVHRKRAVTPKHIIWTVVGVLFSGGILSLAIIGAGGNPSSFVFLLMLLPSIITSVITYKFLYESDGLIKIVYTGGLFFIFTILQFVAFNFLVDVNLTESQLFTETLIGEIELYKDQHGSYPTDLTFIEEDVFDKAGDKLIFSGGFVTLNDSKTEYRLGVFFITYNASESERGKPVIQIVRRDIARVWNWSQGEWLDPNAQEDDSSTPNVFDETLKPTDFLTLQDPDVDRDGLLDLAEEYIYDTDPTQYDSIEKGVSDSEALSAHLRTQILDRSVVDLNSDLLMFLKGRQYQHNVDIPSLEDVFNYQGSEAYKISTDVPHEIQEALSVAEEYLLAEETNETIVFLQDVLTEYPDEPRVLYLLGRIYHANEDYDKALAIYLRLLDDATMRSPYLYFDTVGAYSGLGDTEKTAELYERSIQEFPKELTQYVALANYYEKTNRLEDATKIIYQGLKIEPRYAPFYNLLANISGKKNDFEAELNFYKQAIAYDFAYAPGHFNLAILYADEYGDLDQAYVEATIATILSPTLRHIGLLVSYAAKRGDIEQVTELEKEILESEDIDALVLNDLGRAYLEIQDYTKAEAYFVQAIEYDPDLKNAHNNLGIVYSQRKNFELAIMSFQKAIELDPLYANPHHNLGKTYVNKWWASDAKSNDDLLKATDWLERALTLRPDRHDTIQELGMAYSKLSKNNLSYSALAENYLQKALELEPTNKITNAELGYVYYWRGSYEEARSAWKKAQTLGHDDTEVKKLLLLLPQEITTTEAEYDTRVTPLVQGENGNFAGSAIVSGQFEKYPQSIYGDLACFFADTESRYIIPEWQGQKSSRFCFKNTTEAVTQLRIMTDEEIIGSDLNENISSCKHVGRATIEVSDYTAKADFDYARLDRVVELDESIIKCYDRHNQKWLYREQTDTWWVYKS